MDPLSITAAVVSFVDMAKQIKDFVDKIGQNRQILEELMEDVIEELTELHKSCQDEQGRLRHLDPEWTRSLDRLKFELMQVLDRCMKLTKRRKAHRALHPAINFLISWSKNPEIEAHIYRLRDRVSSVHRRFHYASSSRVERTENRLLVATSEHSVILNRLDSAMSQLLIESHANGTYPASALDHADPDDFEYQYLHRQVKKAVTLLGRISDTYTFTTEETRGPPSFRYLPMPSRPTRASLVRSATIRALETLQLLELRPSDLPLRGGTGHLVGLGNYLRKLGLAEDAAAIFIGVTRIYQALTQRNPRTYLPYVAWGLGRLSLVHFGTPKGLDAAKQAVDICREIATMVQEDYCVDLARSLHAYSDHLIVSGRYDEALTYVVEALAMQRKAPTAQQGSDCRAVTWEASGEERVAFSSARTISRAYDTAFDEMCNLGAYAYVLLSMGRWSEALIIATEAINCLEALGKYDYCAVDIPYWLMRRREDHQYIMSRMCPPSSPLAASISDVAEDNLDNEDSAGEGGSDARSAALVRT
ncbi:hypothetical protein CCMSSC00406_0006074 [Pleurotus cornucopiae]|uniref:Uncharacterized protein n=1 Tax=Pleurotus cornucopiae TaxID=5321 RepID=A0ACB7JBM6_PLECO|nr:hypothetical protein CCMSSC00406_0006074 [Pleurotus cornucopiae]